MHREPFSQMQLLLDSLTAEKPNDRSELDRRYAVTITEIEKIIAYFKTYVVDYEPPGIVDKTKDLNI